jgi:hypothetical protein
MKNVTTAHVNYSGIHKLERTYKFPHPGEIGFGIVILLFLIFGVPTLISVQNERAGTSRGVDLALKDPTFVQAAKAAGYRLEKMRDRPGYSVLARCARSDASGPVACEPFPKGNYPEIDSDYPITVKVQP